MDTASKRRRRLRSVTVFLRRASTLLSVLLLASVSAAWEQSLATTVAEHAPASRAQDKRGSQGQGVTYSLGTGTLHLGLRLRTRTEVWNGYTVKRPAEGANDHVLLLRTKLLAEYRTASKQRFLLELQDSRFWWNRLGLGEFPASCPFADHLDVRRAFVESPLTPNGRLSLKLGRQTITYADKRVFGPGNWGNVGRYWWDAAKLTVRLGRVRTDLLWGQRVIRLPEELDTCHDPYHMVGLYTIVPFSHGEAHLFLLDRRGHDTVLGESGSGPARVHSLGTYLEANLGRWWTANGTLAIQRGSRGGNDVHAWGGHVLVRRKLNARFKPYVGAEISLASGDRNPHDGVNETFDGLFGSISGAYGRMNLCSWKNLRDYQLTAGAKPGGAVHLWVDLHHFELDSRRDAWYWCSGKPLVRDLDGRYGTDLGNELDVLVRIRFSPNWEVFAGGGLFRSGQVASQDPSIPRHLTWCFLQLSYRL